jgi:hypothetical protein
MKNIFYILLLLPTIIFAQYPSNGNQKITLGEQTTADGLIWRGVAATDTVRKPSIDTMAYMVLDTTTNIMWHYKKATSNAWLRLNLLPSDTASFNYVNTYGTQTVNGAKTFTSAVTATRFNPTANTATGTGMFAPTSTSLGFSISGTNKLTLNSSGNLGLGVAPSNWGASFKVFQMGATSLYEESAVATKLGNNVYFSDANRYYINSGASSYTQQFGGHIFYVASDGSANNPITFTNAMQITQGGNVGIGTASPQSGYRLHVVDSVYVGGNVSAAAYTTRSDYNLKDNIFDLKYGLNDVLQLKPVEYTYKSNGSKQLGFIAQDIGTILPEVVSFEELMSVNYQAIIPLLTKAIQEQNALIKALEQRLLILENK